MRDASGVGGRTVREGQEVGNQRGMENSDVQERDGRGQVTRRKACRFGWETMLPQENSGRSGNAEELAVTRPVLLMSRPIRNGREGGRLRDSCVGTIVPVARMRRMTVVVLVVGFLIA